MKKDIVKMPTLSLERQSASKVIAVMNNKGGCGKTTLSIALGVTMARMGKNVLFVDCDPQTNMSQRLSIPEGWQPHKRIGRMFQEAAQLDRGEDVGEYTRIGHFPFLYRLKDENGNFYSHKRGVIGILPGDHYSELDAINAAPKIAHNEFMEHDDRDISRWFRKKIRSYARHYDCIIIDTAPALEGNLLNMLAAKTVDDIIAPIDGLEAAFGIKGLLSWASTVTEGLVKRPNITFAMVKYQADSRWTNLGDPLSVRNSVYKVLKESFRDYVYDNGVHESLAIRGKVPGFGRRTDYDELAVEILKRTAVDRPSVFHYATPAVLTSLQAKLAKIEKESQWKRPDFLEPDYC